MNRKLLRGRAVSKWLTGFSGAFALASTAFANLSFNLIPDAGMPQYAIDGFNEAAQMWSSVLGNDVTVNIQIGYASLGGNIIGDTSSAFVETSYSQTLVALANSRTSVDDYSSYAHLQQGSSYTRLINHTSNSPYGPNSATPYLNSMDRVGMTTANAKVLGLLAPGNSIDATIRFSSDFSFDFNHNGTIAAGKIDFVGVAAHEIGHALGFVSGVDDIDYAMGANLDSDFSSNLLDLFRYSQLSLSQGDGVTDYTADGRDKFFSVDGGNSIVALLSSGVIYGDGNQASHWRDNLGIGIMDPTAAYGEKLSLSATDLRAFDVMGFTIVPEPSTGALLWVGGGAFLLCRKRSN